MKRKKYYFYSYNWYSDSKVGSGSFATSSPTITPFKAIEEIAREEVLKKFPGVINVKVCIMYFNKITKAEYDVI